MTQAVYYSETTTPLGSGASFTGASRDVGAAPGAEARYVAFQALFSADQAGTGRIEVSMNGSTWFKATGDMAIAAGTPLLLSVPILGRFHRAVLVNGATAQGSLLVSDGYSRA